MPPMPWSRQYTHWRGRRDWRRETGGKITTETRRFDREGIA
jgi:hypothetical protein